MSDPSAVPPASPPPPKPDHVAAIYQALGGQPVLLRIPRGLKRPIDRGWDLVTWEDTTDPAYQESLREGNVGVRLGAASRRRHGPDTYHLCTIDLDSDQEAEAFLTANPALRETLRTRGRRGSNLWLWVLADSYPPYADLKHTTKLNDDTPPKPLALGEWRTDGVDERGARRAHQTVIWGLHPDRDGPAGEKLGKDDPGFEAAAPIHYRRISEATRPILIDFRDLKWPDYYAIPWRKTAMDELVAAHGAPWWESDSGALTLNPPFFVAKYATEHHILHEADELRFYAYCAERGLWMIESEEAIRWKLCADFKKVADQAKKPRLLAKRTNPFLQSIVNTLKGCVEKRGAFQREAGLVHVENGMLDLRGPDPKLDGFSHTFYSRNQIPVKLDIGAQCPRFEDELLRGGLEREEDILLLQKLAGQLLLGVNLTQKIVMLTGRAGRGKTTLIDVLAGIIGPENYTGIRTKHLEERFEIFNFIGKTMLIGADVPGHFLMTDGAHVLKALVGKDVLVGEEKSGKTVNVIGDFNVWLSSNSRLKVKMDGDSDAYRRRLVIIQYDRPPPPRPDPQFLEKIMASEASGILNWMIAGAILLLRDLRETGGLVMTTAQKERVDSLLAESDSVREFARKGLAPVDAASADITTGELTAAYIAFCEHRAWTPLPTAKVEKTLPDTLLEVHRMARRNDIQRDGKAQRGYRGLRVLPLKERPAE